MREMIAVRKEHPAFGRGELELLAPAGVAVLAYLRTCGGATLLVANNLSDQTQEVALDVAAFSELSRLTFSPAEKELAPVGETSYRLSLKRYGYCWLKLA